MASGLKHHRIWDRIEAFSWRARAGLLTLVAVVLAAVPLVISTYYVQFFFSVFLFTTLALGWNVLSGFTGYINFGYSGFVGLGAYVTVLSTTDLGLPWFVGLVLAGVLTALAGAVVGYPVLRLRGAYFAIAMLALLSAASIGFATDYLRPITNGASGISFFPAISTTEQYYVMAALLIGTVVLTFYIATSPYGLRLLTIREDEVLAASLGVNTMRDKMTAMTMHAAIAGVCGGMLAFNLSYIDPSTVFHIQYTEFPIIMVLFGSLGTVAGPLLGGVILGVMRELLWAYAPHFHLALLGILIVVLVLFLPEGIVEWLKENDYVPRRRWL